MTWSMVPCCGAGCRLLVTRALYTTWLLTGFLLVTGMRKFGFFLVIMLLVVCVCLIIYTRLPGCLVSGLDQHFISPAWLFQHSPHPHACHVVESWEMKWAWERPWSCLQLDLCFEKTKPLGQPLGTDAAVYGISAVK